MQSSIHDENITGNNEPLFDEKHLLFKYSVTSEVWYLLWGEYNKSNKTKQTPWPLVHKWTIPTEQLPLVDEI
jgi:hypothetical protein